MKDLTINIEEIKKLTDFEKIEIVWDINAFYFNTNLKTYKLECLDDIPTGSDYKYDEIFYCKFSELSERIEFEENNPEFWYKIISKACKISGLQYINVYELFPENELLPAENVDESQKGLNKSTLGLIIETEKGFLPAFILPSKHGFQWHPKFDFYLKSEIDELINENIEYCEIKTMLNSV